MGNRQKNILLGYASLLKGRLSIFFNFLDYLDDHIGRGGGHPNGRDWVWIGKILSDLVAIVGCGQKHF